MKKIPHRLRVARYFFAGLLICQCHWLSAANLPDYPEIGKPCPDFVLTGLQQYPVRQKSRESFKGKPFIVDFFASWCAACFKSLPHLDEVKARYGDRLELLLVGKEDGVIQSQYQKFQSRYHLRLPVCFTSSLFDRFGITAVPFVLWVDAQGIVVAVTGSQEVNQKNIDRFLLGQTFSFMDASYKATAKADLNYDPDKSLLIDNNGGPDSVFLFRSVLSAWTAAVPQKIQVFISNDPVGDYGYMKKGRYQATGIWIGLLYKIAYGDTLWPMADLDVPDAYGRYAAALELHVRDPTVFVPDFNTGKGVFNYSLITPPQQTGTLGLQRAMQRDLKTYFGYQVEVVSKPSRCWVLTADTSARRQLETHGGKPFFLGDDRSQTFLRQAPLKALLIQLNAMHPDDGPFLDETGIDYPIDLSIQDFQDVTLAKMASDLRPFGLLLQPALRPLKVIVIKDDPECNYHSKVSCQ